MASAAGGGARGGGADLTDPYALRTTITGFLANYAGSAGLGYDESAVDALISPGANRTDELRSVDLALLDKALRAVFAQLPPRVRKTRKIDAAAIREAMPKARCPLYLVLLMPRKAGLDGALDFTRFVMTMDGALIAFVTGATFLQDISNPWERAVSLAALAALLGSIVGGALVAMEIATMYSLGDYDLTRPHLRIPGMINVFGFALGALAVSSLAAFELFLEAPPVAAPQTFKVECRTAPASPPPPSAFDCTGTMGSAEAGK